MKKGTGYLFGSIVSLLLICLSTSSYGDKMDKDTHTLLIEKLERVLSLMDSSTDSGNAGSKRDLILRLADLHAERARIEDMEQGQKDADKSSVEAKEDRARSLELYKEVADSTSGEIKGKITFQMAQLLDLEDERGKAQELYSKVASNQGRKYSPEVIGQALTKLGDIYFNKIKYDKAEDYFQRALKIKESPRRDYIQYRIAWCEFHKGHIKMATDELAEVLKNPNAGDQDGVSSFREEASRDLATFISRGPSTMTEVQTLSDVSPQSVRRSNLIYLSDELNRLGKKNAAVYVITVAGPEKNGVDGSDKDVSRDKIEEFLKLAELQYDLGKKDQVIAQLQNAINQWKSEPCKVDDDCVLLKDRFRKLITGWGKAEQKQASVQLVKGYGLYISMFPDAEVNYWAALAARQNSMWREAVTFYRAASSLAQGLVKTGASKVTKGEDKFQKILEGSLLGEIEVAEITHDQSMRAEAYNHYLLIEPNGSKKLEVLYQRAHILYETGKYLDAANAFRQVALIKNEGQASLREKAAHLSLDSLVLAKNDESIQTWATEYAKEFNGSRASFINIAKKAVINHIAQVIDDPSATSTQLRECLDRISTFPIKDASKEERIAYLKDKLIIAERLQDLGAAKSAASELLEIQGLSLNDRQYALSRLEWISELTLNFSEAYRLALDLPLGTMSKEEKILKLAMLAELSGGNPEKHYNEFLSVSTDRVKNQNIIAKIVRRSESPLVLRRYENQLRSNPELLATLALEIFAVHHDYRIVEDILKVNGIYLTPSGRVLSRFEFLNNYRKLSAQLMKSHEMQGRDIKKDLDFKLVLLKRTEAAATKALNSQDWVLQVIALNDIAYHYKRFALDLLSLRMPVHFTADQKNQFRHMVSTQAHGYQAKASGVMKKISDLWNDSSTVQTLFSDYEKTTAEFNGELRKALYDELRVVAKVAPPNKRSQFVKALSVSEAKPSAQIIAQARASVAQNPFNTDKIEKLKILEEKAGKITLVAFLDARLGQIQSGNLALKDGVRK